MLMLILEKCANGGSQDECKVESGKSCTQAQENGLDRAIISDEVLRILWK